MYRLLMIAGVLSLSYLTVGGQVTTALLDRLSYEFAGIRRGDIKVGFPGGKMTVRLNLRLFVTQSFGTTLTLQGVSLRFVQQGRPIGDIRVNQAISLPSGKTEEVFLPLSVGVTDFANHLLAIVQNTGGNRPPLATISVQGEAYLSNGVSIPISTTLNFLDYL